MAPKPKGKEPAKSAPPPKLSPGHVVLQLGCLVTYDPSPSQPTNNANRFRVLGKLPKPSLMARV